MAGKKEEPDLTVGYIAVRLGYIKPEQLEKAVQVQAKDGKPIGQILISLGMLDEMTLEKILALQRGGVEQIMEKEHKTLYACPSCNMKFKIVDADPKRKYLCKYCKDVPVLPIGNPQTLHRADTEQLEFTDESELPPQ